MYRRKRFYVTPFLNTISQPAYSVKQSDRNSSKTDTFNKPTTFEPNN